ncbi:right-handed parallel beta-helix repeat-containing protein [Haladaptatus sp. DFWS20]|uniref:right-handed parallel beta-helix repeat-containing protein n=1 Tax=Haladaptatus sp. DFWS20 TaxID=3403467 RepID=UPI003EBA171C
MNPDGKGTNETSTGATDSRRRTFLRGVGGVVGLATVGRLADRASAYHRYEDDYETVVDMEAVGADTNGDEPINDLLREYAGDDTLLYFPSGRYRMNRQFRFTGFSNFGLLGSGATLVPDDYYDFDDGDDFNYRLFRLGISYNPGTGLLFENFTIDQTAEDTGIRVIEANVTDGLVVKDIDVEGVHDSGTWGPGRFVVSDPAGSGLVENFNAPDGGAWSESTPADRLWRGPTGIVCNDHNEGTMTFRNCTLGGFPDNGLYAANGSGQIIIDSGQYKNSNTASLRIGGQDSVIKNATVIVDDDSGRGSQHALRLESSNYVRVLNTDVEITDPNGTAVQTHDVDHIYVDDLRVTTRGNTVVHGIEIGENTISARIKNSRFDHGANGGFSVWIHEGNESVHVENTAFVGDGGHESARAAIRCDRDDCTFRELDINQTGSWRRRGIEIGGSDCLLYKGDYVVREFPIINYGDRTWIERIYANSTGDDEAVKLYESGDNVYIKKSRIIGGILNYGSDGLRTWDNTTE